MQEEKKSGFWTILVTVILLAVLAVYLFSYQVPANNAAIVYTLGKIQAVDKEPGLKPKWFYPVQQVSLLDLRTRLFDTKAHEILTKDKINISIMFSAGWNITNPEVFIKKLKTVEAAERDILSRVDSARNKVVGKYELSDLVNRDFAAQQEKFAACEREMRETVADELAKAELGVTVSYLGIKQLNFPESVTKQVFKRMQEERATESKRFRTEGQKQAQVIESDALTKASDIKNKALAEAEIIRGKADAQVAEYYKVFKENPELAKFLAELKGFRRVAESGKLTQVVDPATTIPFTVMEKAAATPVK